MRRVAHVSLVALFITVLASDAVAQQVPYLSELFERYRAFNILYSQKRASGGSLASVDALRQRFENALKTLNVGEMLAALSEGKAALEGRPWSDRERYISSLTLETDRLVLEPNQDLRVSLSRMFDASSDKFKVNPTVTFVIEPLPVSSGAAAASLGLKTPIILAERLPIAETGTSFQRRLLIPDGRYLVLARLEAGPDKLAELKQTFFAISDFSDQIKELLSRVAAIKNSSDPKLKAVAPLLSTPEFQLHQLETMNRSRGYNDSDVIDSLDRLDDMLSSLLRGQNPLSSQKGELERAYATPEGRLLPYRIYVPTAYDGQSPRPLVVMLHGFLEDEKSYFNLFDPTGIKREAERCGFFLVSPNWGGLSGNPEQGSADVFEVIKAMTVNYKIDSSRIYLTGHSIGAVGTWAVASKRPDLFAAIAPVSGGLPVQRPEALQSLLEAVKAIPALIVHGSRDGVVVPQQSRDLVAAAQKAGMKIEYMEIAAADHLSVVAESFPAVMTFFQKNSKTAAK